VFTLIHIKTETDMFSYDCEEGKDVSVNLNQNVMVKQDDENKIEKKMSNTCT